MRWLGRQRLWLTLPILAAVYVLLVLAASRWLGGERLDLTRDRLYTLSPGTLDIIAKERQPLDLTLYFSARASHDLPQLRAYHQRVVNMLEDVVRRSDGRIHLAQVDPIAYSEAEDRATAAGLTALPNGSSGESIFFGVAGRNTADGRTAVIPFFLPDKEPFLEYDVARMLDVLTTAHRPRVAIYSELPVWADAQQPAWAVLQQLQPLFDVQRLDATTLAQLDGSTRVLVLIQPAHLSHADVQAVDRYVQAGGRLLVFVDPDSEVGDGAASNLPVLFHAWGVAFDPDRTLLDRSRALTVQSPLTGLPVRDPAVLGLTADEFNRRDKVTRELNLVDVSSAGYFGLLPGTAMRLSPLLQSSTDAMVVASARVRDALDPATLYQGYHPNGEHYAIAVRLQGALPAAFPGDAAPGGARAQVILVADTDLLSDRMWIKPGPAPGPGMLSPFANNGDFVVNAVDDLAGPSNLLAIRGRAVRQRHFTRVANLRRQADEKFKARQLDLQEQLAETEQRIVALRKGAHGSTGSAAQKAAVTQFLQRKLEIRTELRAVQRQLDADIERLSARLKFIDILLMPILVTLFALGFGLVRARRRRTRRRAP